MNFLKMQWFHGMKRPALLVIDMLNELLDPWDRGRRDRLAGVINELFGCVIAACNRTSEWE
jgi:isochorismate hydrolase